MAQIIKTVSVSKQEDEFMIANNISPTRLLRNKVQEMITFSQTDSKVIFELEKKIKNLVEMCEDYRRFINRKKLTEEYLKEVADAVKK